VPTLLKKLIQLWQLYPGRETRQNRWAKTAGVAALVLTLSAVVTTSASADSSQILSHFYDPGTEITPSTMQCNVGGIAIHGSATFGTQTGDLWSGTTSYEYCMYPQTNPGWFSYSGRETLTGSVVNCGAAVGTGSFTWTATGTFQEGTRNGGGQWQIVPGSGTRDLVHISGSGTSTQFVSVTLENYGYFAGTYNC
jgi:hypothetical protein